MANSNYPNVWFYDIESLRNVFTLALYKEQEHALDIYILSDDSSLTANANVNEDFSASFVKDVCERIHAKNKNFDPNGKITLYNLNNEDACVKLATIFSCDDSYLMNDIGNFHMNTYAKYAESKGVSFRIPCDTDVDYIKNPEKYPYLAGYNSENYDTTMLTEFFYDTFVKSTKQYATPEAFDITATFNQDRQNSMSANRQASNSVIVFNHMTASKMRDTNNLLFSDTYRHDMKSFLAHDLDNLSGKPNFKNPRWAIHKNMLLSGRQIDVSNLNEKMRKVGLKKLLGMMGFQILESDKLSSAQDILHTEDELCDLIAYNVSDVINLAELFKLNEYQSQFILKKQLLRDYPELVFVRTEEKVKDDKGNISVPYKPACTWDQPGNNPGHYVRKDRLYIDSTSSRFAQNTLCPYGHLQDDDVVSFYYPSAQKAAAEGRQPVNVLEETKKFFFSHYAQPELRDQFMNIYNYYKSIEGKNFNSSDNYKEDHHLDKDDAECQYDIYFVDGQPMCNNPSVQFDTDGKAHLPNGTLVPDYQLHYNLKTLPKFPNTIPYFDKDGKPTSCFANFSVGGVHGAEYNQALYLQDCIDYEAYKQIDYEAIKQAAIDRNEKAKAEYDKTCADLKTKYQDYFKELKAVYRHPEDFQTPFTTSDGTVLTPANIVAIAPDGTLKYKTVAAIIKELVIKPVKEKMPAKPKAMKEPQLFTSKKDGSTELNKRYVFTSADEANHEDFTSYYPNLLRMMEAFLNDGLGYDRYGKIFDQKQEFGKKMKDKEHYSDEQRALYKVMREGTKLILNSASGAGDATFNNPIVMNNRIIAMRCIGQMFSWRIGQAQSYEGAKITSTNTDGLYSVMEKTQNDAILERESKDIGVEIEPEPLFLISKDTNNRIEMSGPGLAAEIDSASGGDLSCRKGPNPHKMLSHPAIIDWALTEYLITASNKHRHTSLYAPFDQTIGLHILQHARAIFTDDAEYLRMFQNILAPASNSINYQFAVDPSIVCNDPKTMNPKDAIILQSYNRGFYVKDTSLPHTYHLMSAFARKVNEKTQALRQSKGQNPTDKVAIAVSVLRAQGVDVNTLTQNYDITAGKIKQLGLDWLVHIDNRALKEIPAEEQKTLIDTLDFSKYLSLLKHTYENNWRNMAPHTAFVTYDYNGEVLSMVPFIDGNACPSETNPIPNGTWYTADGETFTGQNVYKDITVFNSMQAITTQLDDVEDDESDES